MNILLLGGPGAGKGTQSKKLEKTFGLKHFSPGDILRQEVKENTELGARAREFMEAGKLVPDELIINLMLKRIKEQKKGIILDGFPRNLAQAKALTEMLEKEKMKLDWVIKIRVSPDEIIKRLSSRRVCPECGATYNINFNPPQVEGICDRDKNKLVQRKDDKKETIKKRLEIFEEETRPLLEYYQNKGNVIIINGEADVEHIFREISEKIGRKNK
ncbi:MAG: adenylate kinase [Candidatus Muiribacteriota bacterium]